MVGKFFLAAASLLSLASFSAAKCGVEHTPRDLLALHAKLQVEERNTPAVTKRDTLTVDLYMHAVESANATGSITNDQISQQVSILQQQYNRYGIQFNWIQPAIRTVNDTWALSAPDPVAKEMRTALRKGDYTALNIFIVTSLSQVSPALLGDCTLPTGIDSFSTAAGDDPVADSNSNPGASDGCRISQASLAQTTPNPEFLGFTAVHEVGHWFGLFHTFEGESCSGPGDYIDDTRQEANRTEGGCPANKNTCPSLPGVDPIHNFMDYSDDSCTNMFTPQQVTRMFGIYNAYRVNNRAGTGAATVNAGVFPTTYMPSPIGGSSTTAATTTAAIVATSAAQNSSQTSAEPLLTPVASQSTTLSSQSDTTVLGFSASSLPSSTVSGSTVQSTSTTASFGLTVSFTNTTLMQKRQSQQYLTSTGLLTTDATLSQTYSLLNGQLLAPGAGQISTNAGVVSAPFDATAPVGTVTTTFSLNQGLTWVNSATGTNVAFCVLNGRVQSVFTGAAPANCVPVALVPVTRSTTSNLPSATTLPNGAVITTAPLAGNNGVTTTNSTIINNYYYLCGVTTYYDLQCGCTKTTSFTSSIPATATPVTTTYYNAQCGCTTSSVYLTVPSPKPITTVATATVYNSACACVTSSTYTTTMTPVVSVGTPVSTGPVVVVTKPVTTQSVMSVGTPVSTGPVVVVTKPVTTQSLTAQTQSVVIVTVTVPCSSTLTSVGGGKNSSTATIVVASGTSNGTVKATPAVFTGAAGKKSEVAGGVLMGALAMALL